jgi:hypothetical protein
LIFELASTNSFYSKLYANLFTKLLNDFEFLATKTKKECPYIDYFTNLTNDVFYRIILQKNYKPLNFLPFGPSNRFISDMYKIFDVNYYQKLDDEINNQNIIIAVDNVIKLDLNLKKNNNLYLFQQIKYNNYGTSFINIYFRQKKSTMGLLYIVSIIMLSFNFKSI